ncbi:MAG: hypothetical protein ACLUEV_12295 [Alistipes sp.]
MLAYEQMRGGYSDEFGQLRGRLLELVSLVELELDFARKMSNCRSHAVARRAVVCRAADGSPDPFVRARQR